MTALGAILLLIVLPLSGLAWVVFWSLLLGYFFPPRV